MVNYIWVTTQQEMYHHYPGAPKEVDFLKHKHRHIFKFKIYLEVFGDNRDVEFIMFKRKINYYIYLMTKDVKEKSCEMISNYLAEKIQRDYPERDIKSVSNKLMWERWKCKECGNTTILPIKENI